MFSPFNLGTVCVRNNGMCGYGYCCRILIPETAGGNQDPDPKMFVCHLWKNSNGNTKCPVAGSPRYKKLQGETNVFAFFKKWLSIIFSWILLCEFGNLFLVCNLEQKKSGFRPIFQCNFSRHFPPQLRKLKRVFSVFFVLKIYCINIKGRHFDPWNTLTPLNVHGKQLTG